MEFGVVPRTPCNLVNSLSFYFSLCPGLICNTRRTFMKKKTTMKIEIGRNVKESSFLSSYRTAFFAEFYETL
jgi:hypothetical protein